MGFDVATLKMLILGEDRGAARTLRSVGGSADVAGAKTHKFGKVASLAMVGATVAVAAFGKKSVEAYTDAAKETMQLARVTGMTTKAASQLRFAAEESGVEFKTLSTSTRIFSKNLAGADTSAKKTADMAALLGTGWKDAHGNLIPMNELLPKVADHFKEMPDGPTKTAAAMKLFGRSGADMIKILNKGSDGLKELAAESDKTGNTIGNTDSLKKNIQAQREFHAAITGLMITVGSLLMPIITKLSVYLTEHVAPAFVAVTGFVKHHKDLVAALVPVVVALVTAFVGFKILKSITTGFAALNAMMAANPIGLVVIAIAALAAGLIYAYKHSETFRKIVDGAFKGISKAASAMWTVIKAVFRIWVNTWFTVVGALLNGAAKAFGWVPGLGPKLKAAAAKFNDFKTAVNSQLDGIKDKKVKVTVDTGRSFRDLNNIKQVMADIKSKRVLLTVNTTNDLTKPHPGSNARGTQHWSGGLTWVGEEGRELVDLPGGSRIHDAQSSARMSGGAGGDLGTMTVVVRSDDGAMIEKKLVKLKRTRGGVKLEFETAK